jgi:hypothetical protein
MVLVRFAAGRSERDEPVGRNAKLLRATGALGSCWVARFRTQVCLVLLNTRAVASCSWQF